ncbi:MAG TPA: 4Fe-4S binding protein, partial [Prolixibacteraceae bacterium]|nr:4Fe-4S binding protein [Prolixibacteraceae bacterium]
MAIITSRTNENGKVIISEELCNSCGLCVKVCKDFSLLMVNGKPVVSDHPLFGCMACGQCMAVCPTKAIEVWGREMSGFARFDLPDKKETTTYEQMKNLMVRRRSTRDFKDQEVEEELVNRIIEAALTAPMGLPPSDVHLVVFRGQEKVREF